MDYIHTLLISEDDLNDQVEEISGEVREQQGHNLLHHLKRLKYFPPSLKWNLAHQQNYNT